MPPATRPQDAPTSDLADGGPDPLEAWLKDFTTRSQATMSLADMAAQTSGDAPAARLRLVAEAIEKHGVNAVLTAGGARAGGDRPGPRGLTARQEIATDVLDLLTSIELQAFRSPRASGVNRTKQEVAELFGRVRETLGDDTLTEFSARGDQRMESVREMAGFCRQEKVRRATLAEASRQSAALVLRHNATIERVNGIYDAGLFAPGRRVDEAVQTIREAGVSDPRTLGLILQQSRYHVRGREGGAMTDFDVRAMAGVIQAAVQNADDGRVDELCRMVSLARLGALVPEAWRRVHDEMGHLEGTVPMLPAGAEPVSAGQGYEASGFSASGGHAGNARKALETLHVQGEDVYVAQAAHAGRPGTVFRYPGLAAAVREEADRLVGALPRFGVNGIVSPGGTIVELFPTSGSPEMRSLGTTTARLVGQDQQDRLAALGFRGASLGADVGARPTTIRFAGYEGNLHAETRGGEPVLRLRDANTGEPLATVASLGVNRSFASSLPAELAQRDDIVMVKDYSENEGLAAALVAAGVARRLDLDTLPAGMEALELCEPRTLKHWRAAVAVTVTSGPAESQAAGAGEEESEEEDAPGMTV